MGNVIQVLTFRAYGANATQMERHSEMVGLALADFPGYVDGHCLTDLTLNLVGGVAVWENQEALTRFRRSELYARLMMSPSLDDGVDRAFDSDELDAGDVMSQVLLAAA